MTLYTRFFRSARRHKVIDHPNQVSKNKRNFVSSKWVSAFSYLTKGLLQPVLSMNFMCHLINFLALSSTCVIYLSFYKLLLSSCQIFVNFSPLVIWGYRGIAGGYLLKQTCLSHRRAHAHTIGFFCSLSLSLLQTNLFSLVPTQEGPCLTLFDIILSISFFLRFSTPSSIFTVVSQLHLLTLLWSLDSTRIPLRTISP